MKIDLMRNYNSHTYSALLPERQIKSEIKSNGNNYSENTGYYSGSFAGTGEATANIWNKADKFLEWTAARKVVAGAVLSAIVAGVMRPAFLMSTTNEENRENNIYASSHAIASGIIGLVISSIAMLPFEQAKKNLDAERASLPGNVVTDSILNNKDIQPAEKLELLKRNIKQIDEKFIESLGLKDKNEVIDKLHEYKSKDEVNKLLDVAKEDADFTANVKSYLKNSTRNMEDVIKNLSKENIEEFVKNNTVQILPTKENKLKEAVNLNLEDVTKEFANKWGKLKDIVKANNKAFTIVEMLPDTIGFGPLKAILTIALIPPILKHVFGIEKKKKVPDTPPIQTLNINTNSIPETPSIENYIGGNK